MDDKELTCIFDNLRQLCKHVCASLPSDQVKRSYSKSVVYITNHSSRQKQKSPSEPDEHAVFRKIETHLAFLNKQNDITQFQNLHRRLRRNEFEPVLTNRCAVLLFLLRLSELLHKKKEKEPLIKNQSLPNVLQRNHSATTLSTSYTDSKHGSDFRVISPCHESGISFRSTTQIPRTTSAIEHGFIKKKPLKEKSLSKEHKGREEVNRCYSSDALSLISNHSQKRITTYDTSITISETEIVRELLYCCQGIPGKVIKLDHNNGFTIDPQVKVRNSDLVLKLMELGYLHNLIVTKSKPLSKNGSVQAAVDAAIKKLMSDYYATVASLQAEYMHSTKAKEVSNKSDSEVNHLSVCSLTFSTSQAFVTLRILCDVLHAIQNTKGGASITALYPLRCHGDPRYSLVLDDVINHAEKPLLRMVCIWMVEGELYDPSDEFFISVNTECHDRDLWRNKFILRSALVPKVISETQASMILNSGKAINFLNVICEEKVPAVGMREKLNKLRDARISDFRNPRSELTDIVAAIFDETSKLVLDILVNKFKLFHHFQGLRRYMLLGQGDFVNYFMDLVEPHMRKPASKLQCHELISLLGTAIRGSNAAFEDPDVIKRVSVKILVASGGDWGSDVFGLQYLMHDNLDAALKISDGAYSQVFNFLWRTKRMESILLRLRKERWATKNQLNTLAEKFIEVNGVIMWADKLNLEFLHFARQFHYYILFEVVECLWQNFLLEYKKAKSFDDVILAHDNFIKLIQCKTFHRDESRVFINQLRLIWDLVYELEALEERFFDRVINECHYHCEREKKVEQVGTNYNEEAQYFIKKKEFKGFLDSIRAQYDIINRNYQGVLKKFLLALSSEKNHELTILSDRIDFNDYYKSGDSRISESMKYSFSLITLE